MKTEQRQFVPICENEIEQQLCKIGGEEPIICSLPTHCHSVIPSYDDNL